MIFGIEPVGGANITVAWEVIVGIPLIVICAGAALTITMYRIWFAKDRDQFSAKMDRGEFRLKLEELTGDPREMVSASRD